MDVLKELLTYLVPIIAAALATSGFDAASELIKLIDKLPAWAKQVSVAVVAFVLFKLATLLGVPGVVLDPAHVPTIDIGAWLGALLTYVFKLGKQVKAAPVP